MTPVLFTSGLAILFQGLSTLPGAAAEFIPPSWAASNWSIPDDANSDINEHRDGCLPDKYELNTGSVSYKPKYKIGVHAIRGFEAAVASYNKTFSEYLTETAGQRFDPPVEFEMVPYTFEGVFNAIDAEELDFLYANPSTYSCIGTEVGASALATVVSRLEVRDLTYDLDVFGGVIMTRADNTEINTIQDLKGKVLAAGAISVLMSAQLQFYIMLKAGLSYINDPKQVVFTGNQFDVVAGVLNGDFDVGLVRTDTIERTKDETGNYVDPEAFKIIEPKIYVLDDGRLFPFLHSTPIYPEWPLAALNSVPTNVAYEVQEALLALGKHAEVGQHYEECQGLYGQARCSELVFPYDFAHGARCDTTTSIAKLALNASQRGKIAGFRTSRSYFELRTMQEEAGFLLQNDRGDWHCTRPSSLYDGIICPEGHYKRSQKEFDEGCNQIGLECQEGYDCYCQPCKLAFEVDVYEYVQDEEDLHLVDYFGSDYLGCEKMSFCGSTEQGKPINFRIFDNRQRAGADFTVVVHSQDNKKELTVTNIPGTFAYEFTIIEREVQALVIEVFVNGEQIPQSPIRVQIEDVNCDAIYGENSQRGAEDGECICENNTYEISGRCVQSPYFFLIIFLSVGIFIALVVCVVLRYKRQQSDTVWHVSVDELHFNEPPEIIGQGAFGVVVLGQYRGTKVAVKRVLPPKTPPCSRSLGNRGSMKSMETQEDGRVAGNEDIKNSKPAKNTSFAANTSLSADGLNWTFASHSKNRNSVLKALESATTSSHGSGVLGSSNNESVLVRWLPMCLRFDIHSKLRRDFVVEMRLLSRLRHPCITTVMGAVISSSIDPMLVMEYMDYGSLYDLLHNETMYTGGEIILQIVRDIIQGIQFLHASKPPILHGDLKAKNILVDSRFRAKVADFGFSHIKQRKTIGIQGTPFYMAPEYLRGRHEYNAACDIYSMSMIIFEIYGRSEPFEGEDPKQLLPKICHPRLNKRPNIPDSCPPKMADIMKKCWSANPFFRPSARDLDYILVEMNSKDAEPMGNHSSAFKDKMARKPASLYDVFPKHIADALNAGKQVEPESHEIVTVVFSDIVGFTEISQSFSPLKVSNMLDRLYQAFDKLTSKHNVFKVETIGDAYMGVTNLAGDQFDTHVRHAAEFAMEAIIAASRISIDEDAPEKGTVQIRVGFHTGPVVSNVIGSLNPRYGLFGDTVNTASRMESNSMVGRIHCSYTSARLLENQAPDIPVLYRGKIDVKGKGSMKTYWVGNIGHHLPEDVIEVVNSTLSAIEDDPHRDSMDIHSDGDYSANTKDTELISTDASAQSQPNLDDSSRHRLASEKVSDILKSQLRDLVASRPETKTERTPDVDKAIKNRENSVGQGGRTVLDEATDYIPLPAVGSKTKDVGKSSLVVLDKEVEDQICKYVAAIANMHNGLPFHSFYHASQVLMSAHELLTHIVASDTADLSILNDKSFGIRSDKLAQFALLFATLIHDIDHRGISNACLARENCELNLRYKGRALAEQHAADLGWEVLMSPKFEKLRGHIYTTEAEFLRFRNLVVNVIIATDIFDPALAKSRSERWEQSFSDTRTGESTSLEDVSRKATNVLEHLMQASDIAHSMQDWALYTQWNQRLFQEVYSAFQQDRVPEDPSLTWFEDEIEFWDKYVIPLAQKLKTCGTFGEAGDKLLQNATNNRDHWKVAGKQIVRKMLDKIKTESADGSPNLVKPTSPISFLSPM